MNNLVLYLTFSIPTLLFMNWIGVPFILQFVIVAACYFVMMKDD